MKKVMTLAILTLTLMTPTGLMAADGKALYHDKTCVNCHGEGGKSKSPQFPQLNGQNKEYLLAQFDSIINGRRELGSAKIMGKHPVLQHFSKTEIEAITNYLSSLPRTVQEHNPDEKTVALGKEVYEKIGCKQCHGMDGKGMPKDSADKYKAYPKLNGQHSTYVYNQLKNILAGKRANDKAGIMKKQLSNAKLTDKDLKALALYLSQVE